MCVRISVIFFLVALSFNVQGFSQTSTIPKVTVQAEIKTHSAIKSLAKEDRISKKDIKHSGAQTVAEILQTQADIQLQDFTGDGNAIAVSMRGFGENASSNSLIMLNGMPIVNPDLAPPDINNFPINIIDHIDILNASAG